MALTLRAFMSSSIVPPPEDVDIAEKLDISTFKVP
jgi:hypothetical protein